MDLCLVLTPTGNSASSVASSDINWSAIQASNLPDLHKTMMACFQDKSSVEYHVAYVLHMTAYYDTPVNGYMLLIALKAAHGSINLLNSFQDDCSTPDPCHLGCNRVWRSRAGLDCSLIRWVGSDLGQDKCRRLPGTDQPCSASNTTRNLISALH